MFRTLFYTLTAWVWLFPVPGSAIAEAANEKAFTAARAALVEAIAADVAATGKAIGAQRLDPAVIRAMKTVRRHRFVPPESADRAYDNTPLPIGYGQTISQPYIVALMSNLAALNPGDRVLEVGTGSGYQAAVLAEMGMQVYSMEIIRPLAETAAETLRAEGYDQVSLRVGDGYFGWEEKGPFDGIIVTAAADHIPPPLLSQLKNGGRMVIPVGGPFSVQQLVLVAKDEDGALTTRQILPVRFVPLTRRP
ncbi:MAG: protein-L-isoaspartate(D-aspartate) O-methyltransferase [Desulfococcus multivorans]|jgi:protein-L-isoaspartate(D-aspartate) O-methyltransferase|nr:protein-L-isoaspartate(D-aspartate) O-methyltransferase [Desulfococcus multivorans]